MTPHATAVAFIDAVNQHHIGKLTSLMTEDHTFIDSLGVTTSGREQMRNAWISYFYLVPDFQIHSHHLFENADSVAIFGFAEGTCRIGTQVLETGHWKIPAAWRVVVRGQQVSLWQVYADNEPVRAILASPGQTVR